MNNKLLLIFTALAIAVSASGFTANGVYNLKQGTLISKADSAQSFEKKKKKKKKKHHMKRRHMMNNDDDDSGGDSDDGFVA